MHNSDPEGVDMLEKMLNKLAEVFDIASQEALSLLMAQKSGWCIQGPA